MTTTNIGITLAATSENVDVAAHLTNGLTLIDQIMNSSTPSTQAFGDSANAGSVTNRAARADHKHAMPSLSAVPYSAFSATAWTDFSSVIGVTQSSALTKTVSYATYVILGKIALVQFAITITSAGTGGNAITITGIPSAIQPKRVGTLAMCGSGTYSDTGTRVIAVTFEAATTTTLQMICGDASGSYVGVAPNIAAANTDFVGGSLMYEIN